MKKTLFIIIAVVLAATFAFSACTKTTPVTPTSTDNNPTSVDQSTSVPAELKEGEITFENATCESIINEEDSGTVNVAVASNGAPVTYALKDQTETDKLNNAFGSALSIAPDGTIKGVYNAVKKIKVKIVASAEKCEPVEAEITVSVVNAHLTFVGTQLADARRGVYYAASVALIGETDVEATYTVDKSTPLPDGLSMDRKGVISGVPTTVGRGVPFKVNASAKGYSASTAEFLIDVIINHTSDTHSRIVNFGAKEGAKALTDAYVGAQYVNQAGVAGNASALNENPISYALAEDSSLPEGFELYENGAIFGRGEDRAECTFSVVATADHCEPVTKTFTLKVIPKRIIFEAPSGELTKGEPASFSIATAVVAGDIAITYSMTEDEAARVRNEYGLEVSAEGLVTGTPKIVSELISFKVSANAEGYTATESTVYIRINEPLQAPANGRFEAEYIDVTGKQGTGYSASPTGKNMIDTSFDGMNISNGAFINYMHNDTITLEFVIYAEEDVNDAPLYIQMSSEMGNATLTPSGFGVYTYVGNTPTGTKTTVDYGSVSVSGGAAEYVDFKEYRFGSVSLKKGWNVIQLAVHNNDYRGKDGDGKNITGGPGVDYIRIDTGVSLKWVPCTYNV